MPVFAKDSNGDSPLYYIPVTLTNSQSSATQTGLQVQVVINSSTNSSLYASNLANANWQDGAGNILYSWLESGETNTSPSSVYWLNLGSLTVGASGGMLTIYQVIYATTATAMDGLVTGAEPNYTGTYGQYDNGANVFSNYWNFAGNSLPSGLSSIVGANASVSYSNGVALSNSSTANNQVYIYTNSTVVYPQIVEILLTGYTSSASLVLGEATTTTQAASQFEDSYYAKRYVGADLIIGYYTTSSGASLGGISFSVSTPEVWSFFWTAAPYQEVDVNYTKELSFTDTNVSIANYYLYFGLAASSSYTGTASIRWFRSRLYPASSGILPSVSQGSATSLPPISSGTGPVMIQQPVYVSSAPYA